LASRRGRAPAEPALAAGRYALTGQSLNMPPKEEAVSLGGTLGSSNAHHANQRRALVLDLRTHAPDGRALGDLNAGDLLDGAHVILLERLPYGGIVTYDLLPSGGTGFYWANGILMGSTLSKP